MKHWFEKILLHCGPLLAEKVIRLLYRSMRIEVLGWEPVGRILSEGQPVIIAFWHDQLLMMIKGYPGDRNLRILISASKDGELIAKTMARFGFVSVRGSSNRGGSEALKQMLRLIKTRTSLAITPDGPKGPRHSLKPGVAQVALRSGRPVVPLAFACSRGYRFRSWDRFLLPYPFSHGVYSYGEPVYNREGENAEEFMNRLQTAMDDNLRAATNRLEEHGLSAV